MVQDERAFETFGAVKDWFAYSSNLGCQAELDGVQKRQKIYRKFLDAGSDDEEALVDELEAVKVE